MLRDEGTDKFSFNKAWYLYRERRIVMVKRNIVLGNVANVQEFNRICGHMDFDVDLAQGKYLVDAKSIMGIFSLDLSKPIELNIHSETNVDEILNILAPYIVD